MTLPAQHAPKDLSEARDVRIEPIGLAETLQVPHEAYALVAFAHGSGSSRLSLRNRAVASALNTHSIATLLFDLLTPDEEADRANVFNIALLAERLVDAVHWVDGQATITKLPIGLFGASTGAAAALVAAAHLPRRMGAVVSRGGRPDLAIELNEQALARLHGPKALEIVPDASHLFPEPGALEAVIGHAMRWFGRYLAPPGTREAGK